MGMLELAFVLVALYAVFAIILPFLRPGRLLSGIARLVIAGIIGVLVVGFSLAIGLALLLHGWGLGCRRSGIRVPRRIPQILRASEGVKYARVHDDRTPHGDVRLPRMRYRMRLSIALQEMPGMWHQVGLTHR